MGMPSWRGKDGWCFLGFLPSVLNYVFFPLNVYNTSGLLFCLALLYPLCRNSFFCLFSCLLCKHVASNFFCMYHFCLHKGLKPTMGRRKLPNSNKTEMFKKDSNFFYKM